MSRREEPPAWLAAERAGAGLVGPGPGWDWEDDPLSVMERDDPPYALPARELSRRAAARLRAQAAQAAREGGQ